MARPAFPPTTCRTHARVLVPFVSAIIDCGGTSVRANLVNIEADAEHVKLGMPLKLTTFAIGKDDDGVEAINFGFEPAA